MSNSLKDQLLALGLAPKKAAPQKPKPRKPRPEKPKNQGEISLDQAYRIRGKNERQEKEKAIARKREEERARREINQKIQAIIKEHAVRDTNADTKRNFLYKGRIRSVLATLEQVKAINSGLLGVVYLSGNYHMLPIDKIEEIRQFSADHIPDLSGAEIEGEEENPVPDDLIW